MKQKKLLKQITVGLVPLAAIYLINPAVYAAPPQVDALKSNPITKDIQQLVDVLSAGVGIIVVAMIIVGGIQYSIAGDNPQQLTVAKKRIVNAMMALIALAFAWAFLQWIIPGGVF